LSANYSSELESKKLKVLQALLDEQRGKKQQYKEQRDKLEIKNEGLKNKVGKLKTNLNILKIKNDVYESQKPSEFPQFKSEGPDYESIALEAEISRIKRE
jgi:chromosome segregation ATPase